MATSFASHSCTVEAMMSSVKPAFIIAATPDFVKLHCRLLSDVPSVQECDATMLHSSNTALVHKNQTSFLEGKMADLSKHK